MRGIIADLRRASVEVGGDAVRADAKAIAAERQAQAQLQLAEEVFAASERTSAAIDEVRQRTLGLDATMRKNLEEVLESLQELHSVVERVGASREHLVGFTATVGELAQRSGEIRQIAGLIREVADQTNLLALNAAIEARAPASTAAVSRWWPTRCASSRSGSTSPRRRSRETSMP